MQTHVFSFNLIRPLACLAATLFAVSAMGQNLIPNGDFSAGLSKWHDLKDQPATIVNDEKPEGVEQSLMVDITTDKGKSAGQIRQEVRGETNNIYRFSGKMKSTKAGAGLFQIKPRRGKKELKRINIGNSTTEWQSFEKEFSLGEADNMVIHCRFSQSAAKGYIGQKVWFADLQLTKVGRDPNAPPKEELSVGSKLTENKTIGAASTVESNGKDVYITPAGAGIMDGSSWENAAPGNGEDKLQAAWDATGNDKTLYIGSGTYENPGMIISAGGPDIYRFKKIVGQDTGAGLPLFQGTWQKYDKNAGKILFQVNAGASFWWIQDIRVANYKTTINVAGRSVSARIINVDATISRDVFIFEGGAPDYDLGAATNDVLLKDCDMTYFTKRGLRVRGGCYNFRIVNCHADAGGEAYATEPFQMCFSIQGGKNGVADHDITYVGCSARNAFHSNGEKYWNADGFVSERHVYNLTYIDCKSFDHTDGGWDDKALNPTYVNCVAMRNKRNFRVWSKGGATYIRCIGAYAIKRGGNGTAAGLHASSGAKVKVINSTFHNNNIQVDADKAYAGENQKTRVELYDCIVSSDTDPPGTLYTAEDGTEIIPISTVEYLPGQGEDPKFVNGSNQDWNGEGGDFNSLTFHGAKGYFAQEK